MKKSIVAIQRHLLDEKLHQFKRLSKARVPTRGWIRTLRECLGMRTAQLANRVGLAQPNLSKIEQGEIKGTTSLNTLRKIAAGLDCDVTYALVPRSSLSQLLRQQANIVATRTVARISKNMSLELQQTPSQTQKRLIREIADELIRTLPKTLWEKE